ncbi:glutamate racemase [Veillonella sp.]|uniref:glutamate racemase n=1 Tax=Veillonella sp. TaxID=1926307 RepID=UPI0025DC5BC3|nr:glutamate racemase [Veillonella sp.]
MMTERATQSAERANHNQLPIGVFDSGIGGLTVLSVLRQMFPHEDFVYVGDNANNPVGNRPPEEISEIALNIGHFLDRVPVKMAVVACNTFSVVSLDALQKTFDFPVVGVCKGVHTAIDISPQKSIAVMATAATIHSHKHKEEALRYNENVKVFEQACPELAHLIEEGHLSDELITGLLRDYLAQSTSAGSDTIILGCTHFPFLKSVMEQITGPEVVYVDPSYETANEVKRILEAKDLVNPKRTAGTLDICFTKNIALAKRMTERLIPADAFTIREITL